MGQRNPPAGRGGEGQTARLPNILDHLQSTDEKIKQLQGTLDSRLANIEEQNRIIADALASIADIEDPLPGGGQEFGLLFYPPGAQPVNDPADLTESDYTVTLSTGNHSVDFGSGEVRRADGTTDSLNQSLGEISGATSVSSLVATASNRVIWYVPEEEGGLYSRTLELEGAEITQLYVQTFEDTDLNIAASTGEEIRASELFPEPQAQHPATRDFEISGYDLIASGDWDLSTEKSGQFSGNNPQVNEGEFMGIFLESSDDAQFSVTIEWKDANDNTLGIVDQDIDADLFSASPTGGNHYVYVDAVLAQQQFNVVITDESGGAQNNIDGALHIK